MDNVQEKEEYPFHNKKTDAILPNKIEHGGHKLEFKVANLSDMAKEGTAKPLSIHDSHKTMINKYGESNKTNMNHTVGVKVTNLNTSESSYHHIFSPKTGGSVISPVGKSNLTGDHQKVISSYLSKGDMKESHSFRNIKTSILEKTLTPAEIKKREEIAKAIERDHPGMPMAKKMAIATTKAKDVAEDYEHIEEAASHEELAALAAMADKAYANAMKSGNSVLARYYELQKEKHKKAVDKEKHKIDESKDDVEIEPLRVSNSIIKKVLGK